MRALALSLNFISIFSPYPSYFREKCHVFLPTFRHVSFFTGSCRACMQQILAYVTAAAIWQDKRERERDSLTFSLRLSLLNAHFAINDNDNDVDDVTAWKLIIITMIIPLLPRVVYHHNMTNLVETRSHCLLIKQTKSGKRISKNEKCYPVDDRRYEIPALHKLHI